MNKLWKNCFIFNLLSKTCIMSNRWI